MRTYAALIASLVACKLALLFVPVDYKTEGQQMMLQWWFLALLTIYGAIGVLLIPRTGFAGMATTKRGAAIAILLGFLTGVATIAVDAFAGLATPHHPLPEGLVLYWHGAVVSEIFFHLLPVPLTVFVISNLLLRGRHQTAVFWVATLVLAAWEGRRVFAQPEAIVTYLANVAEIWLFRRYGFTAAIMQRLASYSLWHVAWPLLRT